MLGARGRTLARLELAAVLVGAAAWLSPAEAAETPGTLRRHHVVIQVGAFDPRTETFTARSSSVALDRVGVLGILSYRFALSPRIEIDAELRHWIGRWPSSSTDPVEIAAGFIGPGIRVYATRQSDERGARPYVQGNLYYVHQEHVAKRKETEQGVGFGVSGGLDLRVNRWLSFPLEATYVRSFGDALNDLSGFGISVGVDVSF